MTIEVALQELGLEDETEMAVQLQDLTMKDLLDFARYGEFDHLSLVLSEPEGEQMVESCVDERQTTLVHMAAANGHLSVLKLLLERPAVVKKMLNLPNIEGNTPLHWAVLNNHVDTTRYLLEQGASLEATNAAGKTAWDEAINGELFTVTSAILEFLEQKSKSEVSSDDLRNDSSEENEQ